MRPHPRRSLASIGLLSLLAGCTSPTGGDDELGGETLASSESTVASDTQVDTMVGSESFGSESLGSESLGSESLGESSSESGVDCHYPAGAVEPMALGEVLTPYSWTEALAFDGTTLPLDLIHAPCDDDPDFAWTRPLIVFISLPAW